MNDGAIDFRKLLQEEKKKAHQKQRQQPPQPSTAAAVAAAVVAADDTNQFPQQQQHHHHQEEKTDTIGLDDIVNATTFREEYVEAIDYQKLRQDEQKRVARLQHETALAESWTIPSSLFDRTTQFLCQDNQPRSIYYIPDFLPRQQDQRALMEWLQSIPENSNNNSNGNNDNANGAWSIMQYAKRRVALFDASTSPDCSGETHTNIPSNQSTPPSPSILFSSYPALQRMANALVAQGIFPADQSPNHILVNEYHPGQGIMAHTDGPAYASRTATLSLGSDVLISFTKRPNCGDDNSGSIGNDETTTNEENNLNERICLLQKGSLLVFEEIAYLDYCHGIRDRILEELITDKCLNAKPEQIGTTIQRGYRISLTFRHKFSKQ